MGIPKLQTRGNGHSFWKTRGSKLVVLATQWAAIIHASWIIETRMYLLMKF